MPDKSGDLYLYEAIELRAEYDARIKTVRECLPETRRSRDGRGWGRLNEERERPSPELDTKVMREMLSALEYKRRKLNAAIQIANCGQIVKPGGEAMSLGEALELRKALNERIGTLHEQVMSSASCRVIYKEDRDIVEGSPVSFREAFEGLEKARVRFRELNRIIRAASFETPVPYKDEKT